MKILQKEPRLYGQPCKNVLKKRTQPNILNWFKKKDRINEIVANAGDLEVKDLEVIQNMTITSWIRLDKSYNLLQIRLAKFHNPTILRTDQSIGSNIRFAYILTKYLRKTSSKLHKPKIYNKAIDNLIRGKRWRKATDKILWNLDLY